MIAAQCFTNLDDHKMEYWPDAFPAVPTVGDYVESVSGKRLRVCSVTWRAHAVKADDIEAGEMRRLGGSHSAHLRVELHR